MWSYNGNLHDGNGASNGATNPLAFPFLSPGLKAEDTSCTGETTGGNWDMGPIWGESALGVKAWGTVGLGGEAGEVVGAILRPRYIQGSGGCTFTTDGAGEASLLKYGGRSWVSGEGAGGYVEGAE